MRLAIEALGVKHGGGATVLCDLLAAAIEDPRFEKIVVFCSPRAARRFSLPASDRIVEVECAIAEGNKLRRLWWLERRLPVALRRLRCDVLLCLSGCGMGRGVPHLTMIQNCLPFQTNYGTMAGFGNRLRMAAVRYAMGRSCRSGYRVLVQTETMKDVVSRAYSLPAARIRVITPSIRKPPIASDPADGLRDMRTSAAGSRILYVGNFEPHKNVNQLLQATELLKPRLPQLTVFLTWPRDHAAGRQSGVVCLGYLDAPELAEAYSLADAFVMPSLQETVGLPLLEAMSAGVPIVAADLPYAREVCGSAAVFFDAHSASDLASLIEAALTDGQLRAKLIAEGFKMAETRSQGRPYEKMLDEAASAVVSTSKHEPSQPTNSAA